ncbi:tRNA pseudouridine32 synthase/23S rRNA pseudouridine746 synthase [Arthrobacter silviterrae]|uniref:RNA pseudouridylate synthase n=1 Tax=Arthrobacter silviterrae TaxID=2026658 RepID=A0ABX0DDA5_9MICC|nr:pseudouridine synthase [Arthrobacter silviterrae]MDQ0278655.1 tRNA pseudouridine32 synthase/23S rRNA pseudouridine746 synthase [Arthrobacter silviterrae]NGN83349.1 pseudouridine synthase [Arthrobacter silviterrae]
MKSPLPVRNGVNATRMRMPDGGPWATAMEYVLDKFNHVDPAGIVDRFERGEVMALGGEVVTPTTALNEHVFIWYYRELPVEKRLPVELSILHQDENLVVVDKPHFLPTTPGGMYVQESALVRLRVLLDLPDLVPIHRLDRMTAGVLLFSANPETRGNYQLLFEKRHIEKTYRAVAPVLPGLEFPLVVRSRMVKSRTYLLAQEVPGEPNAETRIELMDTRMDPSSGRQLGLYELQPHTGKTHQLRVHLASQGIGILNDPFYPVLHEQAPDDYTKPLQLLAHSISFTDPLTGEPVKYSSGLRLSAFPDHN